MLGFLELLQHRGKARLAAGKILRRGGLIGRIVRTGEEIAGMVVGLVLPGADAGEDGGVLREGIGGHALDAGHLPHLVRRDTVAAEEQIDRQARDRERQDQHGPRDLIRWVAVRADDCDHSDPRQDAHRKAEPAAVFVQPAHPGQHEDDLQQDTERDDHDALEQ